jgi:predicted nucleic acid-binding protein
MKLILDTSFLIQLMKKNRKAIALLEGKKKDVEDIMISSLSIYELLAGAQYIHQKHKSMDEFRKIEKVLRFLTEVPLTSKIAWKAAEIRAKLQISGESVPDIDLLIACSDEDVQILTFDGDFAPLLQYDFDLEILIL